MYKIIYEIKKLFCLPIRTSLNSLKTKTRERQGIMIYLTTESKGMLEKYIKDKQGNRTTPNK